MQLLQKEPVEQRHHPAHAHHGHRRTQADAGKPAGQKQAQGDRHQEISSVKAVFCQAHLRVEKVGQNLDDTISRIGNQPHV